MGGVDGAGGLCVCSEDIGLLNFDGEIHATVGVEDVQAGVDGGLI